jgi:hypothetical protein
VARPVAHAFEPFALLPLPLLHPLDQPLPLAVPPRAVEPLACNALRV